MHVVLEQPGFAYVLQGVDGRSARVNDRLLTRSFFIAPDHLQEDWPVGDASLLDPADLQPMLALQPEVILLGTGATQAFAPAVVQAACLSRGIGIECMTNAAAARTYAVLAGEGRRVVAGFVLGQASAAGTAQDSQNRSA